MKHRVEIVVLLMVICHKGALGSDGTHKNIIKIGKEYHEEHHHTKIDPLATIQLSKLGEVLPEIEHELEALRVEKENSTKFTLDFYNALFDPSKNTITSPLSFRVLLSLIYQTTFKQSEEELKQKCYFSDKYLTKLSQKQSINHLMESHNLRLINKIFLKSGNTIKSDIVHITHEYNSTIELVDFTKADKLANYINDLVTSETHGFIKNLVQPLLFSEDTALFLLNTLYFKAHWKHPFSASAVYDSEFFDAENHKHNIRIMSTSDDYRVSVIENIKASVIEIPYIANSNFVLWILLPDEDSNIVELQQKLSYEVINQINSTFQEIDIELSLPIFEIDTTIDGIQVMKKLGLNALIDKYEIDVFEGKNYLKVDGAKQKCKIVVNTDGTEASSASYIEFINRSGKPIFAVNRPFIYMILTADSDELAFIGHYSKP